MEIRPGKIVNTNVALAREIEEQERAMKAEALARRDSIEKHGQAIVEATEMDTAKRASAAQMQAARVAQSADEQIEQMKATYDKQMAKEQQRNTEAVFTEKNQAESRLQEQIRKSNRSLAQSKRQFEEQERIQNTQFKSSIHQTTTAGERALHDEQLKYQREQAFMQGKTDKDLIMMRENYHRETGRLSNDLNEKQRQFAELTNKTQMDMEKMQLDQNQKLAEHHEANYQTRLQQSMSDLARLEKDADTQRQAILSENAESISTFKTKQTDPFYRLHGFNGKVEDMGHFYELRAIIPKHEQSGLAVQVRGSDLVVTGSRKVEGKDEPEPGVKRESHGYQSFKQAFALQEPVQGKLLQRYFEGDTLIVRVPKAKSLGSDGLGVGTKLPG